MNEELSRTLEHGTAITRMRIENKRALNEARVPILDIRKDIQKANERGEKTADLEEQLAAYKRHYAEVRKEGIYRILDYRRAHCYYD